MPPVSITATRVLSQTRWLLPTSIGDQRCWRMALGTGASGGTCPILAANSRITHSAAQHQGATPGPVSTSTDDCGGRSHQLEAPLHNSLRSTDTMIRIKLNH